MEISVQLQNKSNDHQLMSQAVAPQSSKITNQIHLSTQARLNKTPVGLLLVAHHSKIDLKVTLKKG